MARTRIAKSLDRRSSLADGSRTALLRSGALLPPAAVADLLGLSPRTLEDWRSDDRGPRYIRISHRVVRYCAADIDAWIQSLRAKKAEPFSIQPVNQSPVESPKLNRFGRKRLKSERN